MTAVALPLCDDWMVPDDTGVRAKARPRPDVQPAFDPPPAAPSARVTIDQILRRADGPFPEPCRDAFELLAETDPARLAAWLVDGGLGRAHLGYAAEALGRGTADRPSEVVVDILLRLLEHESPLVREGTIYGLAFHRSLGVDRRLKRAAEGDKSPGVREAAADILDQ